MNDEIKNPVEIEENELDGVAGGLPAVQKVRDAAVRTNVAQPGATVQGDGSVRPGDGSVKPGDIKGYEGFPC